MESTHNTFTKDKVNNNTHSKYEEVTCWVYNDTGNSPAAFKLIDFECAENGSKRSTKENNLFVLITGGYCVNYDDTLTIKKKDIGQFQW